MLRISGITLPNKQLEVALSYIYGIGTYRAKQVLKQAQIDPKRKTDDLTETEGNRLREIVGQFKVEGDLKREELLNVRRLKEIGCYRGLRHAKHLPVRGQKTKTNSRTVRGNVRKTTTSGRRVLEKT